MTDKENDKKSDIKLLKNIYIFKKIIPTSNFSFTIIILLRFIGISILFNNLRDLPNNFFIKLLRVLCIFQDFQKPLISSNYEIYCFLVYIITFFPMALFVFAYFKENIKKGKALKIKTKSYIKLVLKIAGCCYYLILIVFQHMIEVLTFIYFSYFISRNPTSNSIIVQSAYFNDFIKNFSVPVEFYIVMNSICLLVLNFYIFISFYMLNEPYFKSTGSFNLKISKFHTLFLIIVFNFQAIQVMDLIFSPNVMFTVKLVIFLIYIVSFLIILLENILYFNFHNFVNVFCLWCLSNVFFFALLEIGLYVIFSIEMDSSIKAIFRLIVVNFLTLCLMCISKYVRHWRFISNLESNLMSNVKGLNLEALFYLISLLKESLDDYKKLHHIYELFVMHKTKCIESINCICRSLDVEKFRNFIHIIHKTEENNSTKKVLKFNQHFQEFLNLIEMGIINLTDLKSSDDQNYLNLILLHVDFIYFFKNSQLLSNYTSGKYLVITQGIPFITKYYIYCYKVNLRKDSEKYIQNHSSYLNYYNLLKYIKNFQKIDLLMLKYSEHIHSLIRIRDFYNNFKENFDEEEDKNNETKKKFISSNDSFKIDEVIKICGKIKKSLNKLNDKVKKDYKKDICRNVEMSYKLNNFFFLYNKGVPLEMKYYFLQIETCDNIIKSDFTFLETDFIYPMIINVEFNDFFPIRYISQKFCKEIEYEPAELLGKDFHILIPTFFHKQHLKILNDSIFRQEQTDRQKSVYLISKYKHYIPISFCSSFFPSFSKNITMVLNLQPIKKAEQNEFIFLINLDGKMICFSKNFENRYYLNGKLFSKLNINFLSLFDIRIDKIEEYFKKEIQKCTKKQLTNNPDDSLEDERISFINKNKKNVNKDEIRKEGKVFYKSKTVFYNNILKIKKTVTELELDQEYSKIINLLETKLNVLKKTTSNLTLSQVNISPLTPKYESKNDNEPKHSNEEFKIKIFLKHVGIVPYLYVSLVEENSDSTCPNSEIQTSKTTSQSLTYPLKESKTDLKSIVVPPKIETNGKNNDNSFKRNSLFNHSSSLSLPKKNLNSTKMLLEYSFSNINHIISNHSKREELTTNALKSNKCEENTMANHKDISNVSVSQRDDGNITGKTTLQLLNKNELRSSLFDKHLEKKKKVADNQSPLNRRYIFEEEMIGSISVDAASVYIKRHSGQKFKSFKITKDTIEEKSNKEKKNLSVLFIFLILVGTSCIYNFFHKTERVNYIRKLFNLYHSNVIMKSSVIFLSNNIINLYILSSNLIPPNIDNITIYRSDLLNKINYYSNVLVREKHLFEQSMIDLGYISDDILSMLNKTVGFKYLFNNWEAYTKNNSIILELYQFNEVSSSILYENFTENPNFYSFFLANSKRNLTQTADLKDSATFYVINNLLDNLRNQANLISKTLFNNLIQGHITSKNEIIIYHCIILLINILLFIVLYFMITNSQEKILDMILIIISLKRNFDENITVKIQSFKNLLTNFCDEKVLEFEKHKFINLVRETQIILKKENEKTFSNVKDQENLNKKKLNYDTYMSLPIKVVTYAKICLFIAFLVFLVLIMINLFVDIKIYDELILSNIISANYLERVPYITELFIYYQVSLIMNSTNLVNVDSPSLSEVKNINIYEYISPGDNEFININNYFENTQQNIQTDINHYSNLIPKTIQLEKNLQSDNLCYLLTSTAQESLNSFYNSSYLQFNNGNNITNICINCAKGINQRGLNNAFQGVQNSLKEMYSEFKNNPQIDKQYILNLLRDYTHLGNMVEINFVFETIHMIFAKIINEDLDDFYNYLHSFETAFNIMGLALNSLLIFYIIMGIFKYLQNYYDDLDFSSKKFKKAVIHENRI